MINASSNGTTVSASVGSVSPAIRKQLRKVMVTIASRMHQYMNDVKMVKGGMLQPRTGNARRAISERVVADLNGGTRFEASLVGDLTKAPYLRVQNDGGVIVPKNGKYLTIPVGEALTAGGVPRFTARQLISNPYQFGYSGTFVAKGMLFGKINNRMIDPLFALRERVVLPARRFMETTLEAKKAEAFQMIADVATQAAKNPGAANG